MSELPSISADVVSGALLEAIGQITSDLDWRGALERLVGAACSLTGAQYGVIGLLNGEGQIGDFVIHGLDEVEQELIAELPTSKGLLGVLVDDPRPLRLDDLTTHPRASGFPVNHPPMKTFLGVPIQVQGTVYGNLYLTEKSGGRSFDAADEALVQALARGAGFVIGNAQGQMRSERRQIWLEASLVLSHALEDSTDVPQALRAVAAGLSQVSDALMVAVLGEDGAVVALEHGTDPSRRTLTSSEVGALLKAAASDIEEAAQSDGVVLAVAGDRTTVVVPMRSRLVPVEAMVVLLPTVGVGGALPDPALFAAYADQASLALDRAQGVSERQEHMLVADRDRIARDLHDTVIQRIFATALQLQGLRRTVLGDEVKGRLDEAVGELNTTIRDIRSTIFELKRDDASSLKGEVRGLAREYVPVLGFTPFVRVRGSLDAVPREVGEHLVATLREALSNVARHADADACVVEVEVTADRLTLRISDNGRGIPDMPNESGLRNVRRRAMDLGGRFSLRPEDPHGTLLEWQVPLG